MQHSGLPPEAQAIFPLFVTSSISIDKIKDDDPLAVKIYDILGFTNADNVPLDFIHQFFPGETKAKISSSLNNLHQYSMIQDYKTHVGIHRQLQYVTVETLRFRHHLIPVMNFLVKNSTKILESQKSHENYSEFVLNILSMTKHLKEVPVEKEHTALKVMIAETILKGQHISVYFSCYRPKALKLLEEALIETRKRLGICSSECLRIQVLQAHGLTSDKKYEKAKELLEGVLIKQIQKFGDDHRETLKTQYVMARLYHHEKNYDDATELLSEIYGKQSQLFGEDDPDALKSKERLDNILNRKETTGSKSNSEPESE